MYKAKLKDISKLDSGGWIEANVAIYQIDEVTTPIKDRKTTTIVSDIKDDIVEPELTETLIYPNCMIYCHPEELEARMTSLLESIKMRKEAVDNIEPNLEVII